MCQVGRRTLLTHLARSIAGLRRSDHITVTGFVNRSESRSSSWLSSTAPCTAQLLDTCRINCIESPTCCRGAGWGQRLPTDLTFVHHGWSLSETAHLLLLVLGSGTVCLKTSHLLHRCQCFNVNWRLTCFGTHTQTLLLRHDDSLKFFYYRPL